MKLYKFKNKKFKNISLLGDGIYFNPFPNSNGFYIFFNKTNYSNTMEYKTTDAIAYRRNKWYHFKIAISNITFQTMLAFYKGDMTTKQALLKLKKSNKQK